MMPAWKAYQEEAADFFRSLGLVAETDVTLQGVRTSHDVDVVVTVRVAGIAVRWLVECKRWKEPVSKLHVLALREIVTDLGADRGILLCEVGFQSGAVEAANLTNVQVTSLSALSITSRATIFAARLRDLYDRTEIAREAYWGLPKDFRIAKGLRYDYPDEGSYSGAQVIEVANGLLSRAFRGSYPIILDETKLPFVPPLPVRFENDEAVVVALESLISDLEQRLAAALRS